MELGHAKSVTPLPSSSDSQAVGQTLGLPARREPHVTFKGRRLKVLTYFVSPTLKYVRRGQANGQNVKSCLSSTFLDPPLC